MKNIKDLEKAITAGNGIIKLTDGESIITKKEGKYYIQAEGWEGMELTTERAIDLFTESENNSHPINW